MGIRNSLLKVTSILRATSGCAVDAIRLSYRRRFCCGSRRKVIAAFKLPQIGFLSTEEVVNIRKLNRKDGNTAVRVSCLTAGVPVFTTELALADLLDRLRYTQSGDKAVLYFSLSGGTVEGNGAAEHAFTALFCNGKRVAGGAEHVTEPPRQHEADQNCDLHSDLKEEVRPDLGADLGSQASPHMQEDGLTHAGDEEETLPVPSEYTLLGTPEESNIDDDFDSVDLDSPSDNTPLETSEHSEWYETAPRGLEDCFQLENTNLGTPEESDESDGYETPVEMEMDKHQLMEGDSPLPEETNDTLKSGEEQLPANVHGEQEETQGNKAYTRKKQKSFKSLKSPATRSRDADRSQDHVRGASLWDYVARCAGVVVVGLIVYNNVIELQKYY